MIIRTATCALLAAFLLAGCGEKKEEQAAQVGDEESDAEPRGLVDLTGELVPLLQLVEPLAGEPQQDQPGQADEQKREVAEPQQPDLAARQGERRRAREQGAEGDGCADEVQEQREALLVGSDGGEQVRHRASRSCR